MIMRAARAPRITLWAGALAALALITGVLIGRPRIILFYRLSELRRAPERLEAYLLSEDEFRGKAALRFLEESAGKKELFTLYLKEYERLQADAQVLEILRRQVKHGIDNGILALGTHGYAMLFRSGKKGGNMVSMGLGPEDPARREAIVAHLDAIEGETFRAEMLPGFEFQLRRITQGGVDPPSWPGDGSESRSRVRWGESQPGMRHVCFFRVVEPNAVEPAR